MDWRVVLGLCLTVTWISAGVIYLLNVVGLVNFVYLPTADIGSFLEGAFAPLAFLWLVIGHFMQQKEITANTRAIKIQEQSARRLEVHSARDSYFKLLSLVQSQLGAIAAFHYMSVCGPTGTGEMTGDEFTEQRAASASGDHAWFIRKLIGLVAQNQDNPDVLQNICFGTDIRTRHSENFQNTFKRLLNAAVEVDTDDMLQDALLNGSAEGLWYRLIMQIKGEESLGILFGAATTAQPAANMETAQNTLQK
ncbi:MAG: hypothetical protein ACPG1A_03470 [Halioglobus sp.]